MDRLKRPRTSTTVCDEKKQKASNAIGGNELVFFLQNQSFELASGDASDIVLRMGEDGANQEDTGFAKFLLAAHSPVFRAMLFGSMAKAEPMAVVRIEFPIPVVKQMLQYLCNASLVASADTAIDLYRLADFYQMGQLKILTTKFIITQLNAGTAVGFWTSAHRYRLSELESQVLDYIQDNASEALAGDRVTKLDKACLLKLLQNDALNVSDEMDAFRAVVRWGKANFDDVDLSTDDLRKKLKPLMDHVRFELISGHDLAKEVNSSGLVCDKLLKDGLAAKFSQQAVAGKPCRKRSIPADGTICSWRGAKWKLWDTCYKGSMRSRYHDPETNHFWLQLEDGSFKKLPNADA